MKRGLAPQLSDRGVGLAPLRQTGSSEPTAVLLEVRQHFTSGPLTAMRDAADVVREPAHQQVGQPGLVRVPNPKVRPDRKPSEGDRRRSFWALRATGVAPRDAIGAEDKPQGAPDPCRRTSQPPSLGKCASKIATGGLRNQASTNRIEHKFDPIVMLRDRPGPEGSLLTGALHRHVRTIPLAVVDAGGAR